MYQYRVVTHGGKIYVEYKDGISLEWYREKEIFFGAMTTYTIDLTFCTIWGAKWWIHRQVKADKKFAKYKAEKAKDPVVVWGPYP